MTRVDFYILPHDSGDERDLFACRLIEKAFHRGHRIYIHTPDADETARLDRLLWSFRPDSFLPHQSLGSTPGQTESIEIGHGDDPDHHHDLLINLTTDIPAFFSRFERVAEVVIQQPEALKQSRQRSSFYRDRGYPLNTHDLRNS